MPVKCKVGHFSKGSAKKCTPCDRDKKEYQNDEGATYCKICARGKVLLGAAVCEGRKASFSVLATYSIILTVELLIVAKFSDVFTCNRINQEN